MVRIPLHAAWAVTGGLLICSHALAGPLVISEFRVRGPNGANDEFIEIHNPSDTAHTVSATSGTGYGVAASDGTVRFTIPNGTVIPARGHFLGVNSVGFSLASYPAGSGTTATGDATYTTDISDNAGIALFTTNVPGDFALGTRMDAVGSTSEANTLYKEGTGYPALTPFSIDYSFYRDACGKSGSITTAGACTQGGVPTDTDNNAADFIFVDTNGTSAGAGQRLGAPGPANLSSPVTRGTALGVAPLDTCPNYNAPPNIVRDYTSDPANNSTFGTLDLRFTFTNSTGVDLTRLRFRIVDLTTFPAPSGTADLRPRTSTSVVVTVDRAPCESGTSNVTVNGTTLEQPPSQPNGSGFNGSLSVGAVSIGNPLTNGSSIDVRFLLGLQQIGNFKFGIVPEGEPFAGVTDGVILLECHSDSLICSTTNEAPTASSVAIGGTPEVGTQLTGNYTYADTESDPEGTSTFRWIRNSVNTGIAGGSAVATSQNYTPVLADNGNYLYFCVTPVASAGETTGTEVCSTASAAVTADAAGSCGAAQGAVSASAPVAGLCSAGVASSVTTSGDSHSWYCSGTTSTSMCSAPTTAGVTVPPAAQLTVAGAGCAISSVSQSTPATLPPNVSMPFGVTDFELVGCSGGSATVQLTYSGSVAGMTYWKYAGATWTALPGVTLAGNTATFTIVDNGPYDDDPAVGVIRDPSGPGLSPAAQPIPSLSEWGMIMLSAMLAIAAFMSRTRRRI